MGALLVDLTCVIVDNSQIASTQFGNTNCRTSLQQELFVSDPESKTTKPNPGTIGWIDLAAENAGQIRDFYESVVGWKSEAVPVEDHQDFVITPAGSSDPVAGICHRKGPNADVPGGWMIYIHVDDLAASLETCMSLGGEKVGEIREMAGYGTSCVIKDPSGAMCVLFASLSQ